MKRQRRPSSTEPAIVASEALVHCVDRNGPLHCSCKAETIASWSLLANLDCNDRRGICRYCMIYRAYRSRIKTRVVVMHSCHTSNPPRYTCRPGLDNDINSRRANPKRCRGYTASLEGIGHAHAAPRMDIREVGGTGLILLVQCSIPERFRRCKPQTCNGTLSFHPMQSKNYGCPSLSPTAWLGSIEGLTFL
jgi:hypothetical protein